MLGGSKNTGIQTTTNSNDQKSKHSLDIYVVHKGLEDTVTRCILRPQTHQNVFAAAAPAGAPLGELTAWRRGNGNS